MRPGGYALVVVPALESALRVVEFADDDNKIHSSDFDAGLVYRGEYIQKHYARDELRAIVGSRRPTGGLAQADSLRVGR